VVCDRYRYPRDILSYKETCMRVLIASVSLILTAVSAFGGSPSPAPAPILAAGLPAALVVGGVLLVRRLFKKK
jgi:hypothetical protein